MYKQNLYKKYKKIKEMLRETYYTNTNEYYNSNSYNIQHCTPTNSPRITYSIPFYNIYENETNKEIVFESQNSFINPINSKYINYNKVFLEIIIISYLFSSTLIMGFIKYMFN